MTQDTIIGQKISDYYSITLEELFGKSGSATIDWAKRCYAFIMMYHGTKKIKDIAKDINRAESTTYRYIKWYSDVYVANSEVREFVTQTIYYNS